MGLLRTYIYLSLCPAGVILIQVKFLPHTTVEVRQEYPVVFAVHERMRVVIVHWM